MRCDWSRGNGNCRVSRLEAYVKELERQVQEMREAAEAQKTLHDELAGILRDPEVERLLVRKIRQLGLAK
jgi:hypothetical protein